MAQVDTQLRETSPIRTEVSGTWAIATAVAWVVGDQLLRWLEPAPTQPDALPGVAITAMQVAGNVLLLVVAVGLVRRARWAFTASGVLSLFVVGQVIACPVSGHHAMGAWWAAQAVIAAGLVGLSLAGWQASARSGRASDQLAG